MIEMRWLEYESTKHPETGETFKYPSIYRKLQYRVQAMETDSDDYRSLQWQDWKDVPVKAKK